MTSFVAGNGNVAAGSGVSTSGDAVCTFVSCLASCGIDFAGLRGTCNGPFALKSLSLCLTRGWCCDEAWESSVDTGDVDSRAGMDWPTKEGGMIWKDCICPGRICLDGRTGMSCPAEGLTILTPDGDL